MRALVPGQDVLRSFARGVAGAEGRAGTTGRSSLARERDHARRSAARRRELRGRSPDLTRRRQQWGGRAVQEAGNLLAAMGRHRWPALLLCAWIAAACDDDTMSAPHDPAAEPDARASTD